MEAQERNEAMERPRRRHAVCIDGGEGEGGEKYARKGSGKVARVNGR